MSNRKRNLLLVQVSLVLLALLIVFLTYFQNQKSEKSEILSTEAERKIKELISKKDSEGDVFYNIEYSGLDLAGNRYILRSKEAVNNKDNIEIINMKYVDAYFYFKDGTVLNVKSEEGKYNNKTLDMNFYKNVKADYDKSKLFAQKAEYSNSKSFLVVSEDVIVEDIRGTVFADRLIFDIKKNTLDIFSSSDDKVNAYLDIK